MSAAGGGVLAVLSSRNPEHFGNPVNMIMIGQVRAWLRKLSLESVLVIEGIYHGPLVGTKNRVALRLSFPDAIGGEIEVAWLYALRERRLGTERSRDCILAKIREREGVRATTRTVA